MNPSVAEPKPVGLILSGGLALGAFHAGLLKSLAEDSSIRVDAIAASSIGAFNAAIFAGNPPDKRAGMLDRFWKRLETDALPEPWSRPFQSDLWHRLEGVTSTLMTRIGGVPGLMRPAGLAMDKTGAGPGLYDPSPAVATLSEMVDFDLLNDGPVRVCICATDVETGAPVIFDNKAGDRIGIEHVLASGALLPNLPAVEVDGRLFADGGLSANAPLEPFLSSERDLSIPRWLILADLFPARGLRPRSLAAASERANDLKYATQTRVRLSGLIRERRLEATGEGSTQQGTDLLIVEHREPHEPSRMEKIFDFSRASLLRREGGGRKAATAVLNYIRGADPESPAGLRMHDLNERSHISQEESMSNIEDRDDEAASNRGKAAEGGVGEVKGSGAGAGGGGNPEDYDVDAPGGSGVGTSGQSSPEPVEGDDDVVPPTEDSPKG
ncbi:MAG: patatin-like phospholipase family protein [Sphingobium sp.]|uniref:patatin-like phospholipase family protein n=1 Tax=Sphingobium sp. TaxID=1912891 RepID=UPI0029B489BF|nr:patatin-like phospholipase family protein [Sphingobium sp.]MDX3911080.1 patatin-like phospholipase family protein [Sphingobium sp.]